MMDQIIEEETQRINETKEKRNKRRQELKAELNTYNLEELDWMA